MPIGANIVPPPQPEVGFSLGVLAALLGIVGLSVAMFVALTRRWTSSRQRVELDDWAREQGFRVTDREASAPPPLNAARGDLRAAMCVSDERTTLLVLEAAAALGTSPTAPAATTIPPAPGMAPPPPPTATRRWHVLVRELAVEWPPTGMRPAAAESSLLDAFSLTSFPLMGPTDRFVVFGVDSAPARRLHKSHVRALLPPDVGLLLHGRHLVLDFSSRPFDTIAFGRMIALADQLVAHVPPPT